jgi:hypothetical protein
MKLHNRVLQMGKKAHQENQVLKKEQEPQGPVNVSDVLETPAK